MLPACLRCLIQLPIIDLTDLTEVDGLLRSKPCRLTPATFVNEFIISQHSRVSSTSTNTLLPCPSRKPHSCAKLRLSGGFSVLSFTTNTIPALDTHIFDDTSVYIVFASNPNVGSAS